MAEGTISNPVCIGIKQTSKGGGAMGDEHLDRVRELAYLKWQLLANESARANGLITASMYEFARDTLKKDIASLEYLCYNVNSRGGSNIGIKIDSATD